MGTVTVIIPVYNAERYLEGCISSILSQDYNDLQVIIINDGSVDKSEEICLDYAKRDHRIVYYKQKNSGVSAARNKGLSFATGQYLCFIDADDQLEEKAISNLVSKIEEAKADLSIGSYKRIFATREEDINVEEVNLCCKAQIAEYVELHCREACVSSVWGKLYRRELIEFEFPTEMRMGEDIVFNINYLNNIESAIVFNKCVYRYDQTNEHSLVKNISIEKFFQTLDACMYIQNWVKSVLGENYICKNVCYKISDNLFSCASTISEQDKTSNLYSNRIRGLSNDSTRKAISVSMNDFSFYHKMWFKMFLVGRFKGCAKLNLIFNMLKRIKVR